MKERKLKRRLANLHVMQRVPCKTRTNTKTANKGQIMKFGNKQKQTNQNNLQKLLRLLFV